MNVRLNPNDAPVLEIRIEENVREHGDGQATKQRRRGQKADLRPLRSACEANGHSDRFHLGPTAAALRVLHEDADEPTSGFQLRFGRVRQRDSTLRRE